MNKIAFTAATLSIAGLMAAEPAAAQVGRFDRGLQTTSSPLISEVQFQGGDPVLRPRFDGGYGRPTDGGQGFGRPGLGRPGFDRPGFGGPRYGGYYRHRRGFGVGAGLAGLAAGAVIGGAIASQAAPAYGYGYDEAYAAPPPPSDDDASGYCAQRYRSYDPGSGTYIGYDGLRHPCP